MPTKICLNCKNYYQSIKIDAMFCSQHCGHKYRYNKKIEDREKKKPNACPCCNNTLSTEGKYRKGNEYPFLCIKCEELVMKRDDYVDLEDKYE